MACGQYKQAAESWAGTPLPPHTPTQVLDTPGQNILQLVKSNTPTPFPNSL